MSGAEHPDSFDELAEDLRALRSENGTPSFSDIAVRVGRLREARGMDPVRARPARTTVYDVFRAGRTRMNADLVADIAQVLGAKDPDRWRERCGLIRNEAERRRPALPDAPIAARPAQTDQVPDDGANPVPTPRPRGRALLVRLLLCVGINMLGILAMRITGLPLYLDTVGIGIAAIALGPWWGVAVALATHAAALSVYPLSSLLFTGVSLVSALVWGFGWRALRAADAPARQVVLHLAVGVLCSVAATPVLWLHFHGFAGHPAARLDGALVRTGQPEWFSILLRNLTASLPDKLLSGLIAVAVAPVLMSPGPTPPFDATAQPGDPAGRPATARAA